MIVEDDPEMRDYYLRLFERHREDGYVAAAVPDGKHALEILQREAVDLVLLDWNLPSLSGDILLKAIRAHPKTRSIGVVMITCRCCREDEVRALDAGADDYMSKPFDEEVLLARLRNLARRRAQVPERRARQSRKEHGHA